ncbi:MAG: hypothetical protein OEW88_08715 [Gammaproteobacteria bacterium]|nr:hypothetical protein [Gammaproteobacteria bacterium]
MPARTPARLPPDLWLRRAAGLLGAAGVLVTGVLALLQPPPAMPPGLALTGRGGAGGPACALGAEGFLRGRFFGALNLTADWSGPGLACDGMQKPDGAGVRLFFSGDQPGGGRVSVLIGLAGRAADLAGGERPANVTVIDERKGRFFSSGGPGRCWASIGSVAPLPRPAGGLAGSRIDGLVFCVGALPSVGDRSSLTLSDLQFSGWLSADAN